MKQPSMNEAQRRLEKAQESVEVDFHFSAVDEL
jgi:hypothetical protein